MFINKQSVSGVMPRKAIFMGLCALAGSILVGSILVSSILASSAMADPMKPPGFGQVSATKTYSAHSYRLTQVLTSEQRNRAVINEQVVAVGDSVSGAKVVRIDQDKVTLNVAGKRKVLVLNQAKGFTIKRETE